MTERGNVEGVGGWRGVCMCVWKEGWGGVAALRCNYNDALHMIKKKLMTIVDHLMVLDT